MDSAQVGVHLMAAVEKELPPRKESDESRVKRGESLAVGDQWPRSLVEFRRIPHESCFPQEILREKGFAFAAGSTS